MNVILMYDRLCIVCLYDNIEPSTVVEWLEEELLSDSRILWSLLCEEEIRVVNCHSRVVARPCMAYSAELCYEVYECAMCKTLFSQCAM